MKTRTLDLLDFTKVDSLLEGFNKSTGFVTAILDLEGNVLSTSGWRQICTEFHRVNPETSKRCTISDTVLSGKMEAGEKYHFYQCLNGLVDVAVPIIIRGEHIANLFSGQFFFEEPDLSFFQQQAVKYGFNPENYLNALRKVPIVSKERVWEAMDFLLNMTQIISEMAFQKLEQMELNEALSESERYNRMLFEQSVIGLALTTMDGTLIDINQTYANIIGRTVEETKTLTYWDITPKKYRHQEQEQLDLLARTGRYGPFEKEYIHKEGHLVPVRLQGQLVERNGEKYIWSSVEDISERKLAEASNKEKDMQFRKLSANVPDLIFQFTRRTDGTYCVPVASEGIQNIFGCTPEEVVNDFTPIGSVLHPDDVERVIDDIEYSAKHLTYFTCEFRVQIPGRPVQWIFSRSSPERLPDGSITWYGFNANITQRKEFENALRESEEKFRKIYEEGPFGMALISGEFTFMMANKTFCDITGYTETELQKRTFRDITFPDDKDIGIESIKKLIKGEIPIVKLEKRYVRKDEKIIWAALTVAAIFDKSGKHLYNLSIIEDISLRKQAEEKIQTLNERLALLVEAIQELSISTSMDSIMATVRTSARKLVNADGTTFILREGDTCYYADEDTVSPLWKGQRFAISHCISGWAMLNKQPVVIEDIYRDSRVPIESYKSTFVKSLAIAPIRLNDPLGAIGAYWGQTFTPSEVEIKLLNTLADAAAKAVENIQLIEGLEVKVSERTSQLKAANQELEAFSYSVSHDLRAPLRHINGYVDLLNSRYQESLPEQARHYLASVTDAARRMGVLIDDLLYFSRTSRQELSKKKFSMNALVDEVLEKMKPDMQGRKIHLSVQKLPEVVGDHALLKQVWANLLENAVKYTKLKELAKISVECKEEKENYVFSVSDNGVGFDMQYSQKLFGVFQRLHAQTEFEGTGIGLANVKRIIHKHNGKVWAEAEVDKGATFYFSLPKE